MQEKTVTVTFGYKTKMEDKIGYIDDRFPFDFTKDLEWNTKRAIEILVETGFTQEEAEKTVNKHKNTYFYEDGTRKDGRNK